MDRVPPPFTLVNYRSARCTEPFHEWLFKELSPMARRSVAAAVQVILSEHGPRICACPFGRRHGPDVFELRLPIDVRGGTTPRDPSHSVLLHIFCHPRSRLLVLLSGGAAATRGLHDARWRLRDLKARAETTERTSSSTSGDRPAHVCSDGVMGLGVCGSNPTNPESPAHPSRPSGIMRSPGAGPLGRPFALTYGRVIREAQTEGPAASRHLGVCFDRYRLACALSLARRERRLSQSEVSALACVPRSEISRIETGHANPTIATIGALARAVGLEVRLA